MNEIGKRDERIMTVGPRISGADGWTPLLVERGVKALPMHRERSPRWGLSEENGELMGMRRRPGPGWNFVMEDIGGEMVMRRNCPEIQWGKAKC